MGAPGGYPYLVKRRGDAEGALLLSRLPGVGERVQQFGHGLLLCHEVMMPNHVGQHQSSIRTNYLGQIDLAKSFWHR